MARERQVMEVRYFRDPDTDLPHIFGHGVSEAGAEWILAHPGEDEACSGDSRQALGQTEAGRYLRIIYVPDEIGDGVFVVTRLPASNFKPSGDGRGDGDDEETALPQGLERAAR